MWRSNFNKQSTWTPKSRTTSTFSRTWVFSTYLYGSVFGLLQTFHPLIQAEISYRFHKFFTSYTAATHRTDNFRRFSIELCCISYSHQLSITFRFRVGLLSVWCRTVASYRRQWHLSASLWTSLCNSISYIQSIVELIYLARPSSSEKLDWDSWIDVEGDREGCVWCQWSGMLHVWQHRRRM